MRPLSAQVDDQPSSSVDMRLCLTAGELPHIMIIVRMSNTFTKVTEIVLDKDEFSV